MTGTSPGRSPTASRRRAIERAAFDLFAAQGFEATTVDDIAAAAGIGRRTFFRYFASKNDVAWGDFDTQIARIREELAGSPPHEPVLAAVGRAIVRANRYTPADVPELRRRMALLSSVPALRAHAMLRYADWRRVIAEFVATRLGVETGSLLPQAISQAALGVSLAAYGCWLESGGSELAEWLDQALSALAAGFPEAGSAPP